MTKEERQIRNNLKRAINAFLESNALAQDQAILDTVNDPWYKESVGKQIPIPSDLEQEQGNMDITKQRTLADVEEELKRAQAEAEFYSQEARKLREEASKLGGVEGAALSLAYRMRPYAKAILVGLGVVAGVGGTLAYQSYQERHSNKQGQEGQSGGSEGM